MFTRAVGILREKKSIFLKLEYLIEHEMLLKVLKGTVILAQRCQT